MPSTEIVRVRNCIHITVMLYFHLKSLFKSVSPKILGLKLVKLDCIIIQLDHDTIKKAKNELDGACGLPLILTLSYIMFLFIADILKLVGKLKLCVMQLALAKKTCSYVSWLTYSSTYLSYHLFRFLIGLYPVAKIQYFIKKRSENDKNTIFLKKKNKNEFWTLWSWQCISKSLVANTPSTVGAGHLKRAFFLSCTFLFQSYLIHVLFQVMTKT